MKLFFFLGHTFFEQSLSIGEEIQTKYPEAEIRAIVASRKVLIDELDKIKQPKIVKYDWLNELEEKWLSTSLDINNLRKYEDMLGAEKLRQIIISDREIGVGFVSCGIVERTKLMDMILNDHDKKWSYIVGLLDYYFSEFEKNRPDAIFAYCVAGAHAFALGVVAEYLNIPFTQPVSARVKHFQVMDDNYTWNLRPVSKLYKEALKNESLVKNKMDEAKIFIDDFRNKPVSPQETVTWISEIRKNNTLAGYLKILAIDIIRWVAIKLGLKGTKGVLRQRYGSEILKFNWKFFRAVRKMLSGGIKEFHNNIGDYEYLYFPLHVDPEASTMVISPMFTDQVAVIESIAKAMPAGVKLVVKEHIPCLGKRPDGFYKRISQIPDVILLSPFVNNFDLIKNAKLVCTITGTAGWESMILGKPPLVIGDVHYLSVGEGVLHWPDLSSVGEGIRKALNTAPVSDRALQIYIASIMTTGLEISPNDMWFEKYADMDKRKVAVKLMAEHIMKLATKQEQQIAA